MSIVQDRSSEPHRPHPLQIALFTHLDAQRRTAADYQQQYQEAYAAFVSDQQAVYADALRAVQEKHAALASAGDPNADPSTKDQPYAAAYQAFVQVQQDFQSGALVKEPNQAAGEAFRARLEDVVGKVRDRAAADERAFIGAVKEAVATIDPDAIDGETVALLQQAVFAIRPGAGAGGSDRGVEVEQRETPAKPQRPAKTSEPDKG